MSAEIVAGLKQLKLNGILKASDLAGYRNEQVFIRGAPHVPL